MDAHEEIEHGAKQHEAQGKQHHAQGLLAVTAEQVHHPGKQPLGRPARHLQPAHDHLAIEEAPRVFEQTGLLQLDTQVAINLLRLLQEVQHHRPLPVPARFTRLTLLQHSLVPDHIVQARALQLDPEQIGVAQVGAVQVGVPQVGLHQGRATQVDGEEVGTAQIGAVEIAAGKVVAGVAATVHQIEPGQPAFFQAEPLHRRATTRPCFQSWAEMSFLGLVPRGIPPEIIVMGSVEHAGKPGVRDFQPSSKPSNRSA
ncbi:hypothetical protein D9M71_113290 [compost metagenome]